MRVLLLFYSSFCFFIKHDFNLIPILIDGEEVIDSYLVSEHDMMEDRSFEEIDHRMDEVFIHTSSHR